MKPIQLGLTLAATLAIPLLGHAIGDPCRCFGKNQPADDRVQFVGNPYSMIAVQLLGSMPMRSLTAPRMRCLQPR